MKLLLLADVFGWRMTGLMGDGGAWFIGYSRRPPQLADSTPRPKKLVDACDCKGIVGDCGRCDGACEEADGPRRGPIPDNVVPGPWRRGDASSVARRAIVDSR